MLVLPNPHCTWNLREGDKKWIFYGQADIGVDPPTPPYGQLFVNPQSHHTVPQDDHLQEAGPLFENHKRA